MKYIELFLSQYTSKCTRETYFYTLKNFFLFIDKSSHQINKIDILKWKASLTNYATSTQAQRIAIIKSYFHFLTINEIINTDPTVNLTAPRSANKPKENLSMEEALLLFNNANLREQAILAVFLSTGIRVSELINLQLKDYLKNKNKIVICTKGNKYRTIILNKDCQNYIDKYLSVRKEGCSNLFVSNQGTPMSVNTLNKTWKKLAFKAHINKNVTNHTFRSTFITEISKKHGITLAQIAVGHNNIQTTRKYIRGLEEEAQQIMQEIRL